MVRKKSKRYDLKKKRSYRSRFSDKKINTAIEKKIQAIARREDDKQIKYYVNKHLVLEDPTNTGTWANNIAKPTQIGLKKLQENTVYYHALTDIGGYGNLNVTPSFPLNDTATIRAMKNMEFRIKTLQASLKFANQTSATIRVRAAIIYIPNLNSATDSQAQRLLPSIHMLGDVSGKYTGIFAQQLKANATYANSVKDCRIVASKTIKLPPCKPMAKFRNIAASQTSPANMEVVAYPPFEGTNNQIESINTYEFRDLNLYKTFKTHKKLYWNPASTGSTGDSPALCGNGNYWLVYTSDIQNDYAIPYNTQVSADGVGAVCYGTSGCKFSLGDSMSYITNT